MKELKVNIENTGGELVIRTGDAHPIILPEIVDISGDINTIGEYVKKRKVISEGYSQSIDEDTAIVTVDKKNLRITFDHNPSDKYAPIITGTLEVSEELKPFQINQTATFTREALIKLLKFSRLLFKNSDKHAEILSAYTSFTASTNTDLKQESDNRGNKIANFSKKVDTNIPNEFILEIPIFKGQPKESFRVEILLDVTDAGARFWFESVELSELQQLRVDEIFSKQLEVCQEYVIVHK